MAQRQAVVVEEFVAQRAGLIGGFITPALLKFRYDQLDEIDIALRIDDARQVKAVDIRLIQPVNKLVGHLRRAANNQRIAATEGVLLQQPPPCPAAEGFADRLDGAPGALSIGSSSPKRARSMPIELEKWAIPASGLA